MFLSHFGEYWGGRFMSGTMLIGDYVTGQPIDIKTLLEAIATAAGSAPSGGATAAKQDSIITALGAIAGYVDGLEGFVDGIEGLISALGTYTDGLESVPINTGATATPHRLPSCAATTNATLVKNSAGRVFHVFGYNASASVRYLKLYNKASAAPTVGTDTPFLTLPLPSGGFAFDIPSSLSLGTGIGYALTTGAADADTGALTAADIVGLNILYA